MNDDKFKALIRLLDDPDPVVTKHVEEELFTLGPQGIEKLEAAWESVDDALVQSRIEELISRIQISHFSGQLLSWRMSGGQNLLEGWLLLTQMQYPMLNVSKYRNELQRLVSKIWLQLDSRMNELERLIAINKQLYSVERYSGNYKESERPENNYISFLLDTKQGNSLSLSALYLIICEQLDIPLQVVNFMGYYAIRCYRRNSHFYIDAYNQGMFFTPQQVQEFLKKMDAEQNVNHYKPLSNIYIVLDLIKALITAYGNDNQPSKAALFDRLLREIEIKLE
jgi:regulator of sirC expression with transglutaminase-like and TPR domain